MQHFKHALTATAILFLTQSCIMLKQPSKDEDYAKENFTVENGAIPADFAKTEGTLLVILHNSEKYDKRVKESFEAYNGPYKFVTVEDLEKAPYTDLTQYPYTFNFKYEDRDYTDGSASGQMQNGSFNVRRFYIYDRNTKKFYTANATSSFFNSLIDGYVYNLNQELSK